MVREALIDRLPEERRPRLMPVDTALGHDAAAAAYEACCARRSATTRGSTSR